MTSHFTRRVNDMLFTKNNKDGWRCNGTIQSLLVSWHGENRQSETESEQQGGKEPPWERLVRDTGQKKSQPITAGGPPSRRQVSQPPPFCSLWSPHGGVSWPDFQTPSFIWLWDSFIHPPHKTQVCLLLLFFQNWDYNLNLKWQIKTRL